jgi:DNA-binding IclR family transcriptional regulator
MAPAATSATEALVQALGGQPGANAADLADGAGIGRSTANKLLVKLAAERRVVRQAGGRRDGRRRPGPLDAAGTSPRTAGQGP